MKITRRPTERIWKAIQCLGETPAAKPEAEVPATELTPEVIEAAVPVEFSPNGGCTADWRAELTIAVLGGTGNASRGHQPRNSPFRRRQQTNP